MKGISEVQHDRLDFLKNYSAKLNEATTYSIEQHYLREVAKLKSNGVEEGSPHYESYFLELELFGLDVRETFYSQMVVLIWSYIENLLLSACKSIAHSKKIEYKLSGNKSASLVCKVEQYFKEELEDDIEIMEADWNRLANLLHVRNFIAHESHRPGTPPINLQRKAVFQLNGADLSSDGMSIKYIFITDQIQFFESLIFKTRGSHWALSESFFLPEDL